MRSWRARETGWKCDPRSNCFSLRFYRREGLTDRLREWPWRGAEPLRGGARDVISERGGRSEGSERVGFEVTRLMRNSTPRTVTACRVLKISFGMPTGRST